MDEIKLKVILIGIVSLILLINASSSSSIKNAEFIEINGHKLSHICDDNTIVRSVSPQNAFTKKDVEKHEFVPGEIIVKFKSDVRAKATTTEKGISKTDIFSIDMLNEKHNVYSIEKVFKNLKTKNDVHGLSTFYKFDLPRNTDILLTVEEYQKDPNVEYAGPNIIMSAYLQPNDPYYYTSGSWGQEFLDLWGLHKISVDDAWSNTTGSDEIVVAVIDTGVDYNQEDIEENMWINDDEIPENGIDDDDDGFIDNIYGADIFYNDSDPMDGHGHGTHCAGTIAAVGNNSLGVVGVNWQTKIMAVKALSDQASAGISSLAGALVWAADNGADVLSNSWGSELRWPSEPTIEAAVRYAYDKGCIIVFAAGNEEDDVQYYCPQNMDETITVAATDHNDEKAFFSNWGEKVDVCAPGIEILSLRANGTDFYHDGTHIVDDDYYYASGTSMSCPHVTGLAALLLSKNHSLSQDAVRTLISYTVDEINSPEYIGRGRINASRALQRTPAAIRLIPFQNPTDVKGLININGTAWGESFEYYTLEYGKSQDPTSWTTIINSTIPVQNGVLASIDTTELDECLYTLRLRLICSDGEYEKSKWMIVNNENNLFIVDNFGGPGVDYTTIQDAVDDAGYGDSIYVHNGTYYERVFIDKKINLIGENKDTTFIDGTGGYYVIYITADLAKVNGFTIQNSSEYGSGITICPEYISSSENTIFGNIITNNGRGITIGRSYFSIGYSSFNKILGNKIIGNSLSGVYLGYANNNTISDNTILNNSNAGVFLYSSSQYNNISGNTITYNDNGILFNDYPMTGYNNNNTIFGNTISRNNWGIYLKNTLYPSEYNIIYHNNFVNNTHHSNDPYNNNLWDADYPIGGNYWDDYTGIDADGDGVGDTPYIVPNGNQDRYPFIDPDGWQMRNWWPMFHQNQNHNGFSTSNAPNTNNTLWSQPIGWKPESSPVVAYNKAYIGTKDSQVLCFDAENGNPVWNYTTVGRIGYSSPAVYDNKVYIGSAELPWQGTLYCLNAETGEELWIYSTNGSIFSSPTVISGKVYFGCHNNKIYCLDAYTGDYIWSYTTSNRVTSSPAVVGNNVYVGSLNGRLYCLDASNGEHIWHYQAGGAISYSSPAVINNKVYFGSWDYNVYCINATDGSFIWSHATGEKVLSSPAVSYGYVYVGSYDNKVYCLDAEGNGDGTTNMIWEYETGSRVFSSPAVADGKVYVGSRDGTMYCFNATLGSLLWSYYTNGIYPPVGGIGSSPAIANGKIYIASTDGNLYAFGDLVLKAKSTFRKIK